MSEIELLDYGTRGAWLASRTTAIGASEVAALFSVNGVCLSPYTSLYALWLQKTGQLEPEELDGEWIELGNVLEPAIANLYARRTGRTLWQGGPFAVAQHSTLPFFRATPDRWVIDAPDRNTPGLLQIKNANAFKAHDWDQGPPDYIECQVQAEMAVTGREWNSVAPLIGGSTFKVFDVERNLAFIEELEEQVRWFWGLVESRTAPEIDASPRTLSAIKRLHPADNGETAKLPEESVAWLDELESAKSAVKDAEAAKTEAESKLRAAIGAATFGVLPDGRSVSLKTTSVAGRTQDVQPYSFRTLRIAKKGSR